MTYATPEHLVRIEWAATRIVAVCTLDRCDWTAGIGYPEMRGPLTEERRLQLYRQANQVATMHGFPDLDWPGAAGVEDTGDPTADAGFWARLRQLAARDAR